MATIQDPAQKLIDGIGGLRRQARAGLNKLPAADPMRKMLSDIDGALEDAERHAKARLAGVGIYGKDPLKYLQDRMKRLERETRQAGR